MVDAELRYPNTSHGTIKLDTENTQYIIEITKTEGDINYVITRNIVRLDIIKIFVSQCWYSVVSRVLYPSLCLIERILNIWTLGSQNSANMCEVL